MKLRMTVRTCLPINPRHKIWLGLMFCLMINAGLQPLQGQEIKRAQITDSITLELYNQQKWDELTEVGDAAIESGLNHYYMQMRVGIAWYEKKNYRKSIRYFEKAAQLNPFYKTVFEYLYFAYLMGGRPQDAEKIRPRLSKESIQRNNLGKRSIIREIYLEGGPGFAANKNLVGRGRNKRHQNGDTIYNSSYYYNNTYYGHAGIKLRLHPAIMLYQGYGYVNVPVTEKINHLNTPVEDFEVPAIQYEYYGNLEINLPGSFVVTPAFHKLWLNFGLRVDNYDPGANALVFDTVYENEQMYVTSLSLKKDLSIFAMELSGTYGEFGHATQKQIGLATYSYPFGNLDFYTKTGITRMWNDMDDRWIFHQMIGGSAGKNLWLEAELTLGQLQDYAEKNAFVIYNSPEEINFKFEGSLLWELSQNIGFSVIYRYMERENRYLTYTSFEDSTFEYTNYSYHSLIGGVKWKF
jgi:tetratricopeptide (TPR) repeat protein